MASGDTFMTTSLLLSFFSILQVLEFELRSLSEEVVSSHSQAMPFYKPYFFFLFSKIK